MDVDNTVFKWIIPNFSSKNSFRSKDFFMPKYRNTTWSLSMGNCNFQIIYFILSPTGLEKMASNIQITTTVSVLNRSKEKVFLQKAIFQDLHELERLNLGIWSISNLRNCLSDNDELIIFLEIEIQSKCDAENSQLKNDFEIMITDKKFGDVSFRIGEKNVRAHKDILTFRSKVFKTMFATEMVETITNNVDIVSIDYDAFIQVLHFIYTGKTEKMDQLADKIFEAAHLYQINDLQLICEKALSENLNFQNAIEVLKLADKYGAQGLRNNCLSFINQHYINFKKSPELKTLSHEILQELIAILDFA